MIEAGGDDRITGNAASNDILDGQRGNDTYANNGGTENVNLEAGTADGNGGDDTVRGEPGNDDVRCSWPRGGSHVSSLPWSAPLRSRAKRKTSRRRESLRPAPCRSCAINGSLREAIRGTTSAIRDLTEDWLGWQDSNLRYTVPKTAALPLGYTPTVPR